MATGKVKWFNNAKGYGFILADEGNSDLFAHYSSIEMDGYKTLKAGQDVLFEITDGPKGLQATNIRAAELEESENPPLPGGGLDAGTEVSADLDPLTEERATSRVLSVTVDGAATDEDGDGSTLAGSDGPQMTPGKASRSN